MIPPALLPLPVDVIPLTRIEAASVFDSIIGYAPFKALLPIPILVALAPLVWWFFRDTWKRLDAEAVEYRRTQASSGKLDYRPMVCLVTMAIILTLQEYYGGRSFYDKVLQPALISAEANHPFLQVAKWDELYGYAWWCGARIIGYVLIPFPLWKLLYPNDSLLDLGFRVKGFFSHLWIYALCLAVVVPAMFVVASQPDFGSYYPFYKTSSRSWLDFLAWELMYFAQFFALEAFFRGWVVGALRKTMGAGAIFVMAVPYCMIHYGKPYLETNGAIVAGIVLGSLAMRTRSIYAGFLVHVTVAGLMDWLSLWKRGALPTVFWPLQ